jgi:hypothetical protein
MRSVPFSCKRCKEAGSPTGMLVFVPVEVPNCKYHDEPMVQSEFYDLEGNRIKEVPSDRTD